MKRAFIVVGILALLAAGGHAVFAQETQPILQGGNLGDCLFGVREEGLPSTWAKKPGSCKLEDIFTLGNNIIQWGVGISGALALLMYIIGGVWMIFSAGNSSRVERGKDIITGTTIALFFILGSWLLIDFTVRALRGEPDTQQLQILTCDDPASEGKRCGDNQICFQGACRPGCERLAYQTGEPYRCQNPTTCVSGTQYSVQNCVDGTAPGCEKGLCPGDETNICCYHASDLFR